MFPLSLFPLAYFNIREEKACEWFTCAECTRDEHCKRNEICIPSNSFEKCDNQAKNCVCYSEPKRCISDHDCKRWSMIIKHINYPIYYRKCIYLSRYGGGACAGTKTFDE